MAMEGGSSGVCAICLLKEQRYTCPRCNVRYCSLECYKHNKHVDCSEIFYRNCFMREMKERKVSDEERRAIMETIQKVEEENPIVDFLDEEAPLEERLAGIDLDKIDDKDADLLWEKLTSSEQEEFKKMVASGCTNFDEELSKPWTPWWTAHRPGLVEELGRSDDELNLPQEVAVPPFESLSAGKPASPLIGFNLINVVYAYAFYQRLFNGKGTSEFPANFCEFCLMSSDVLKKNISFPGAEESLCAVMHDCTHIACQHRFSFDQQFTIECARDVAHILTGPCPRSSSKYVVCLLSDLHSALNEYRKSVKTASAARDSLLDDCPDLRKQLFVTMKKLEFLLSWSASHREELAMLSIEVSELYKNKMKDFKENNYAKQNIRRDKNLNPSKKEQKTKIVELS